MISSVWSNTVCCCSESATLPSSVLKSLLEGCEVSNCSVGSAIQDLCHFVVTCSVALLRCPNAFSCARTTQPRCDKAALASQETRLFLRSSHQQLNASWLQADIIPGTSAVELPSGMSQCCFQRKLLFGQGGRETVSRQLAQCMLAHRHSRVACSAWLSYSGARIADTPTRTLLVRGNFHQPRFVPVPCQRLLGAQRGTPWQCEVPGALAAEHLFVLSAVWAPL